MKNSDEIAAELVEQIAEKCFHGVLIPFPEVIVSAILQSTPCITDAGEADAQEVADALHRAAVRRLEAQRAAEQTQFPA